MKPTFHLSLFLILLSFSALGAQNNALNKTINPKVIITEEKNTEVIIDLLEIKEATVAKIRTDMQVYLNIERKESNIKFLFPEINRRKLV